MYVIVRCAPAGSPIAGALDKRMEWTIDQIFAADRIDQMNSLIWSLGGGHGKRPKPVPRPWVEEKKQLFKGDRMTVAETDDLVAAFRSGQLGTFQRRATDIEGVVVDD